MTKRSQFADAEVSTNNATQSAVESDDAASSTSDSASHSNSSSALSSALCSASATSASATPASASATALTSAATGQASAASQSQGGTPLGGYSNSQAPLVQAEEMAEQKGFLASFLARFRNPIFSLSVIAGTAALSGGIYFAVGALSPTPAAKTPAIAPAVVTVQLTPAVRREIDDSFSVTGSVSPWDPITVTCETSGLHIQTINVEEGATVKKGQILATIYSGLLEAQLAQLKARLLSSEATLRKSIQPNRPEDILALQAAVSQAEAVVIQEEAHKRQSQVNLKNAESNEKRYRGLQVTGAISEEVAEAKLMTADNARHEVLSADRKVESAKMAVDQAKQHLLVARRGGRVEDVQISRANIDEIKAQIKHLEEQIKQTIVRAPDDGVISRRDCHIGDTPASGSSLFGMIRKNKLELRAQVSDLDLVKFKPGQEVIISTTEADKAGVAGRVWLVSPQVDPSTRMGTVRITLPSDAWLKPGMFVRGEVKLGKKESLTVPINSVVNNHGEAHVFTVDGNRALARTVRLGARLEDCIEIKDGLKENELIVDKGARFLNDRDIVRIAPKNNASEAVNGKASRLSEPANGSAGFQPASNAANATNPAAISEAGTAGVWPASNATDKKDSPKQASN